MSLIRTLHALIDHGTGDGPLLVLLHGRGSDEQDLFPLGRMLSPNATVASPRAPFPGAPWGYGSGWAWYRFLGGTTPESASFEAGQDALDLFITSLRSAATDQTRPLIIGGFSQGGTSAWRGRASSGSGDSCRLVCFRFHGRSSNGRATLTR